MTKVGKLDSPQQLMPNYEKLGTVDAKSVRKIEVGNKLAKKWLEKLLVAMTELLLVIGAQS